MTITDDMVNAAKSAVDKRLADIFGGCFAPSGKDEDGALCADGECFCARQCAEFARAALEAGEAAAWSTDMEAAPKDETPVLASQSGTVFEAFYDPGGSGQTWTLANEHWTDAHATDCQPEAWRLMPSSPTPPTEGDK